VDEIVPTVEFPPEISFTLQLTVVSVVLVTVAAKVTWLPSTTEPLGGTTLTVIEGGGGGAAAPPPPQPRVHAPAARRARKPTRVLARLSGMLCGRGRMPFKKQAKGQRNKKGIRDRD
jgi:hypothetical protein